MRISVSSLILTGGLTAVSLIPGCLSAQDPAVTPAPPPAKQTTPVKKTPAATPAKAPARAQAKTPVKTTAKAPAASGIPKDAVETTPGFYSWTDKSGKAWTYRRTPFGVTRWPADSVDTQQAAMDKRNAATQLTTAVQEGDSIRFEEATPFGKRSWLRKKSELTDSEQKIWDQQQKNTTDSRPAEKE